MERLTPLEESFERWRKRVGLALAPLVFGGILLAEFNGLTPQAHRLAAVMSAVVVLWITEALPMPVTAMAGASLCVMLRVAPAITVFSPFADPLMFLFIGSFILARALFTHRLDRRCAFGVLSMQWVGARPSRILFGFGAVTAFISAWISNTATTAMMYAIGMSILAFLFDPRRERSAQLHLRYATALMLITTFAASVGGLATPIGTAPNLIGLGYIKESLAIDISFFQWMTIGVPVVVALYLFMFVYLNFFCPAGVKEIPGSHEMLSEERARLGPWTRGQCSALAAFLITIALWVVPGLFSLALGSEDPTYKLLRDCLPESVAAMVGVTLLFLLPGDGGERAMTWREASQIDWGVVLLYGGGFALGSLSNSTGLAAAVGHGLTSLLPIDGEWMMLVAATAVAVMVSESTSNTASANIVVPVVIAIAQAAKIDPLAPAIGATLGSSLGFMLPVSTPCNAIVYGSGYVPLGRMIRYGLLLDIAGVVVVVALVWLIVPFWR